MSDAGVAPGPGLRQPIVNRQTNEQPTMRMNSTKIRRTAMPLAIIACVHVHTVDMLYPNEDGTPNGRLNSKGLLRRSNYTPKPSYFAYQCLCALFDAETRWAERPLKVSAADNLPLDQSALLKATFVRQGRPLYAYRLPADLRKQPRLITVDLAIPEHARRRARHTRADRSSRGYGTPIGVGEAIHTALAGARGSVDRLSADYRRPGGYRCSFSKQNDHSHCRPDNIKDWGIEMKRSVRM